jgi:NitT/TauT family transport system substrate-binding protein
MNRRRFMTTTLGGAAAWLGDRAPVVAAEAPLETTQIRLVQIAGICVAPQDIAEELLNAEGFTDVQQKILAQGTDWRFFNELKKELKG